jgi:hypothetical protein
VADVQKRPSTSQTPAGDPTPGGGPPVEDVVMPLLSHGAFVQAERLPPHLQGALRAWMRQAGHDPSGHYSLVQWRDFITQTRTYPVSS